MKKACMLFLVIALMFGLFVIQPAVLRAAEHGGQEHGGAAPAAGAPAAEPAKAPAPEAAPAAIPAPQEAGPVEEESDDAKVLKEAAAKLKASDPELAAKLEKMAEDFSW